jgi:hypothetical protein
VSHLPLDSYLLLLKLLKLELQFPCSLDENQAVLCHLGQLPLGLVPLAHGDLKFLVHPPDVRLVEPGVCAVELLRLLSLDDCAFKVLLKALVLCIELAVV